MTGPVAVALSLGLLALQAPDGRTEARELDGGDVVWRTEAPGIPLAFHKDGLVVLGGEGARRLHVFDAKKGGAARVVSEPFGLPALRSRVGRAGTTTTRLLLGHWMEGGKVIIQWTRHSTSMSGVRRPPTPAEHARIVVDPDRGAVEITRPETALPEPTPRPPGVLQEHGSAAVYRVGGALGNGYDALFTSGRHGVGLEFVRRSASELELWMQRYDPKTLNKRERLHLLTGNLETYPWITVDGRYVVVTRVTGRNRRELQPISLETGRPATKLPNAHRIWSDGPLVFSQHEAPSELVVRELSTGRIRWKAPVRPDPAPPEPFKGPPPP